jgi:prevent-host-death family protein
MKAWQAAEAKQNFSKVVDAAARQGPQLLMRHSEPVAVVISMDDYNALKSQANREFAKFLLSSPMEALDFDRGVGMSLSSGG